MSIAFDSPSIPAPATSLVGRSEDLARLTSLLTRPEVRLVTLMGPGGVGKTRLALELANDLDTAAADEVFLVLLAHTKCDDAVLAAIARALGVAQMGNVGLDTQIADAIGDRHVLLILDNVEQIANEMTFLPGLLGTCPHLRILATSRTMLRFSAEHVFPVEPLATSSDSTTSLAPATALFIERAQAVRPDLPMSTDDIKAIDAICRQVDGLPLAIELAAARTRFLSPGALRDRLTERLQLLVDGPRDAPERQRTLRATLTWSHDLLGPSERILFRRLAVFEPGGPLDAINPVCNAAGDLGGNVEEILASLVDHSLVRVFDSPNTGPRVRILNTIREFAQEQLELSGEQDAVRLSHMHWFANHVVSTPTETWRTGTEELRNWTLRNVPDVDNFAVTLDRLLDRHEHVTALRMVSWLVPFWLEIGQLRDITKWVQRILPFAEEAPIENQAYFARMAAIMCLTDDRLDDAERHAAHGLALSEQTGQPRVISNALNILGQIHWRKGNGVEGERLQRKAIAIMDNFDALGGALFASQIADELIESGELDRAEPLLREAMPIVRAERPDAMPMLQGSLGYLLMQRGDLDEAGAYLERSLDYHLQPPHRLPSMLAGRLLVIGELALLRNDAISAARLISASLMLCQKIGITVDMHSKDEVNRIASSVCAILGDDQLNLEMAVGKSLSVPEILTTAIAVTRIRDADGVVAQPVPSALDGYDLTPREQEVLVLLAQGKSNPVIADELFISQRTVTTHLSRLYAKLDVSSRTEAMALAVRLGLVATQ